MGFVLLRGRYHVQGFQPDGDSLRFAAEPVSDWARLPGRPPRLNSRGMAQLRLEGIDALETHYAAGGVLGTVHQPLPPADAARDRLLALLGITGVVLASNGLTVATAADDVPGFILSREVEIYGRPVAFAFAGEPPAGDPDDFFLDTECMRASANVGLLEAGLAYPIYYTKLFHDLRGEMTRVATEARMAGRGVWAGDRTGGCLIDSLAAITDEHPLLPKLFRRLTSYFAANGGSLDLAGFKDWLAADSERVRILSLGHETGLDNVIEVDGQTVRLAADPTDLVFIPRQFVPA
jgi:endonuclease YncB( thermonuclease family)